MTLRSVVVLLLLTALADCSGGGSASPVARASAAPKVAANASGTVTIAVPRGKKTASRARKPAYVSPSTTHANLSIDGVLYPGSCYANSCTISWNSTSGTHTFTIEVDDGFDILAAGSNTFVIQPGSNNLTMTLNGVAASIVFPTTGTSADIDGSFSILDHDGNPITLPGSFDNIANINVSSSVGGLQQYLNSTAQYLIPDSFGNDYTFGVNCNGASTGPFTIQSVLPATLASGINPALFGLQYPSVSVTSDTYECVSGSLLLYTPGTVLTLGTSASPAFLYPYGVAVDSSGNVYVADRGNNLIREIGANTGSVSIRGAGAAPAFNQPSGVAVDASGNIYVADATNNLIRKIDTGDLVTTLGTSASPAFSSPYGVAADTSGNVYVGDRGNNLVREISTGGTVTTLPGSGYTFGGAAGVAVDANGNVYVAAPNGAGQIDEIIGGSYIVLGNLASPAFSSPYGVAVDANGNVYVADTFNAEIRKIDTSGTVTTLGASASPAFSEPIGIAVDAYGDVFVADAGNNLIREILH